MRLDHTTRIRFEHDRTTLDSPGAPEIVIAAGAGEIAQRLFRHVPPTPGEIERAIDEVEDALASTGLRQTESGDLRMEEPQRLNWPWPRIGSGRVTRDEVESQFQRLASVALGHPRPRGAQLGTESAATLLILRECMHHLGFTGLVREDVSV